MRAAVYLAALAWAIVALPVALLLLSVAVTWDGRNVAFATLTSAVGLLLLTRGWLRERRAWQRAGAIATMVGLACVAIAWWHAPSGRPAKGARVQVVMARDDTPFQPFAWVNLVPEVDQLMLGSALMPFVDALFTHRQGVELRRELRTLYSELELDPDFHALGSGMVEAYDELFGFPFDRGRTLIYVPKSVDRTKPAPVLMFFHGSGGNWKAFLWILSRVADRRGMVVIAPNGGMGNWRPMMTDQIATHALDAAERVARLDRNNVHLLGLSNGGRALSQFASSDAVHPRSLAFASPVFDSAAIGATIEAHRFTAPTLVVSGTRDDRVPFDYVASETNALKAAGVKVTLESIEGANHFLFFSHRAALMERLVRWLDENGK